MDKYDKSGINKNTKELLFKDGFYLDKSNYGSKENLYIIRLLQAYTKKINISIINNLIKNKKFKNITYNKENNIYEYSNGKYVIPFKLISESIKGLSNDDKKELETKKRLKKCHTRSMYLSANFKDSKVLTGITKCYNYHVLHSVVEVYDENQIKIIDWTRNLVLNKEDYIKLFDFHIINEVESIKLLNDIELMKSYGLQNFSIKAYLTFRDELVNDLEKNKFLIDEQQRNKKH